MYVIYVVVLIPFAMLLYETDEEKGILSRICRTICYVSMWLIAAIGLALIALGTMREA